MSAHTPGPWNLELDAMDEGDIGVFGTGMVPIAIVDVRDFPDDDMSPPRETALANGHLMAAAPDLLAVLRAIEWSGNDAVEGWPCCPSCGAPSLNVDVGEDPGGDHAERCDLAAAIAKAEGR